MYILILAAVMSYNNGFTNKIAYSTSVTTQSFASEANCLHALNKVLDFEKAGVKIKAVCVQQ